jgi:hypothetical protein
MGCCDWRWRLVTPGEAERLAEAVLRASGADGTMAAALLPDVARPICGGSGGRTPPRY